MTPAVPAALIPASVQSFTHTLNPSQPSAVSMERVAEVKVSIAKFEDEFADLMSDTQAFICHREGQDRTFFEMFRGIFSAFLLLSQIMPNSSVTVRMKVLVPRTFETSLPFSGATATIPTMA